MFKFKRETANGIVWARNSQNTAETISVYRKHLSWTTYQWFGWNSYLDGERVASGTSASLQGARRAAVKSIRDYRAEQRI